MRFASLGSGSRGNGTLVEGGGTCVLIDCGFSVRETEARLQRLGRTPADLGAVLVTHEHSDHVAGVGALARKYKLPVYATQGTGLARRGSGKSLAELAGFCAINPQRTFSVGNLSIRPVLVPHDASEPCQFIFSCASRRLGVLTDLGSLTTVVVEAYRDCDALMLECNHDPAMLASGPYPPSLKRRVGGAWGHLSNQQAATLIRRVDRARLQRVVMSHLSEHNNTIALATAALMPALAGNDVLIAADQAAGLGWQEIA